MLQNHNNVSIPSKSIRSMFPKLATRTPEKSFYDIKEYFKINEDADKGRIKRGSGTR